ncbi:MAG: methionyl-tRNA formyltransferase [Lachnospiraceae bacterium]|nr:methionyl-tRNA formyltransferase [Lachnospiraceae bacterium]
MDIVYMGTPDFAVPALEKLIEAGHKIVAVVTQPDRQRGRGKEVLYSPVKECALKYGIPVFQPAKIKAPEAVEQLRSYHADIFVAAAFGQILSKEILEMPRYGCVNIHASLLPKYRGAAPIQWAVINGEDKTGVTIMQMDEGLDTGDILTQREVLIAQEETGESLFEKLSILGAELLVETLDGIWRGDVVKRKQDASLSTYARMLKKEDGRIDWSRSSKQIEQQIRGMNSWPSAYTMWNGKTLKIWKAHWNQSVHAHAPGTILDVERESVSIACGEGVIRIMELQLEGKKRMAVKDFLLGYHMEEGSRLE